MSRHRATRTTLTARRRTGRGAAVLLATVVVGASVVSGGVGPGAAPEAVAQVELTPFPCDGTRYLMQPSGDPNSDVLGRIRFPAPGEPGGGRFERIAAAPFEFNAMGFNHDDGLIYGVKQGDGDAGVPIEMFRVGSGTAFDVLGTPLNAAGVPIRQSNFAGGAMLRSGHFVGIVGNSQAFLRIDVTQRPPRVLDANDPSVAVQIADLAVNPVDDLVYAYEQRSRQMVRIDPRTGVVTPAGGAAPSGAALDTQGSTWIDGQGRVTILGGNAGGGGSSQDTFYTADFDADAGAYGPLREIGVEDGLGGSGDGASCAYGAAFDKTVAPASVTGGDEVTYTYTVTNGSADPRTYTFSDTLDDGRTYVGAPVVRPALGSPQVSGNRLVIGGIQLARRQTVVIEARVLVPATAPAGTMLNQAVLTGDGLPGDGLRSNFPGNPDPADPTPLTVGAAAADLVVGKTLEGGGTRNTVEVGDTFAYTVTVTNRGPNRSGASTVSDVVPAGLTPVTAQNGEIAGQVVTWRFGPLDAGETRSRRLEVRATSATPSASNVAVVARVDGPPDDPGNNSSTPPVETTVTEPPATADLAIGKTGPGEVVAGEEFDYTITVDNLGPATATGSTVTDVVPAEFTPLSASDNGVIAGQTVTWSLGAIEVDAAPVTRTVRVRAQAEGGTGVNRASVRPDPGAPADPTPGNDESPPVTTVIGGSADLAITKDGPTAVEAGAEFDYTITVDNLGPSTATASTVTDEVPAGFTPLSASDNGVIAGQTVTWSLGAIAVDAAPVARTVRVRAPADGAVGENTASVAPDPGAPPDPRGDNDRSTVVRTTVSAVADLAIAKTGPASVTAGEEFDYTITVDNLGPSTATSSVVTDVVPAAFTPLSASDGGTVEGQTVTWSLGAIAVDAAPVVRTVRVRAAVDGGDGANTATVRPGPDAPGDPDQDNDTSVPVPTTIVTSADLALTKSGPADVDAGGAFDWTVALRNDGPSTARDVVVTDTVPAGLTVGTPSDGGTVAPGAGGTTVVTWDLGDAVVGTRVLTVPVTAPAAAGAFVNTARVTTATPDPDGAPDAAHEVLVRGFTPVKTAAGPGASVRPGDTVTYTVTVANPSAVPYDAARGLASFRDDLAGVLDDADVTAIEPAAEVARDDAGFVWTGPLAAGASRDVTVTAVVRAPGGGSGGDGVLRNAVVGGTNCAAGSTAPECAADDLPVRSLALVKVASSTAVEPGERLVFRVDVTNTGGHAFTATDPAIVDDDLSGVLDDATFESATAVPAIGAFRTPTAAMPSLTWRGPLDVGATVRLEYGVLVDAPQRGDGELANTVASEDAPDCLPADPCGPPETPLVKAFLLAKAVDVAADAGVAPGDPVEYTITVTNSGRVAYDDATFDDDLSGVLDDAELVRAETSAGTLTVDGTTLTWTGDLPVADTPGAVVTVVARVRDPNLDGDHRLANVVVGGANCRATDPAPAPAAVADPACTGGPAVPVKGLTVTKTPDATAVRAGGAVEYSITVENTGRVAYTADDPAEVVDDLTGVLDDATYDGGAVASDGGDVVHDAAARTLTWRGPLAVGATVTITYAVTTRLPGPDPASDDTRDHVLRNAVTAPTSNCVGDAPCRAADVPVAAIRVTKTADRATATHGDTIAYRVTVENVGAVAYLAADPGGPTAPPTTAPPTTAPPTTSSTVTAEPPTATTAPSSGTPSESPTPEADDVRAAGLRADATAAPTAAPTADVSGEPTADPSGEPTTAPTGEPGEPGAAVGPATFTDDVSAVVDDAQWLGDVAASAGSATYAPPALTWSGPLPIGATAEITYSVRVNDPATGDGSARNVVVAADSNCECAVTTAITAEPPLADTGSDVRRLLVAGGAAIAFGVTFLLVAAVRRRGPDTTGRS